MEAETRLVKASKIGQRRSVRKLLKKVANQAKSEQKPVLLKAIEGRHAELVAILLEHGADPNCRDKIGETPLHVALRTLQNDTVVAILKYSVDVNQPNNHGLLPLHQTIQQCNRDLLLKLILKGADVNLKNSRGQTPFMSACLKGYAMLALILIQNGNDMEAVDKKGWSASDYAILAGMCNRLKRLLPATFGAKDNAQSSSDSHQCKICNQKLKSPSLEALRGSLQSFSSTVGSLETASRGSAAGHDANCRAIGDMKSRPPFERVSKFSSKDDQQTGRNERFSIRTSQIQKTSTQQMIEPSFSKINSESYEKFLSEQRKPV